MSSMFDELNAADGPKLALSSAAAQVTDAELLAPEGVELLVFGVIRSKIEGGPSDKPMEVWHAFGRGSRGLVPRSIRGRAALARDLRFHAADRGLVYVDPASGELHAAPPNEGAVTLADRATGAPALLYMRVKIDPRSGRAAGNGRGFAYQVTCAGLAVAQARARYPELTALPLGELVQALPDDGPELLDAEPETAPAAAREPGADEEEAEHAKRGKRRGR